MLFTGMLLFMALFLLLEGVLFLRMNEKNLAVWEKLPRNRIAGGTLGVIVLLAFLPNVRPLFSPEENLFWLIPAALALALLSFLYLDHLFARAAAGGVILLTHGMLGESFSADLPGRSFFALMCLIGGTFAIFIAAKPYWLRDCFRAMCRQFKWRLTGAVFSFLWSAATWILLVQQIGRTMK